MDIDALIAARRQQWGRLDTLTRRRRLSGTDADELVTRYRSAAQDLSVLRSSAPDPQVIAHLSTLVSRARGRVSGARSLSWAGLQSYVVVTLPAALYRVRWWTLAVMVACVLVAVIAGWWTLETPSALAAVGSPEQRAQYANQAFASYYSEQPAPDFASLVWTNNARIATICLSGGLTGVLPLYVLWGNSVAIGQSGAVLAEHGLLTQFFALILPHGLLELTCVFTAGAAGLFLFWTMLVPGPRSRVQALATEGRVVMNAAVALTMFLALAGLIEAFVTPAPIVWGVKIVIGALAMALLWAYTLVLGRRAHLRGRHGDLSEDEAGYTTVVAD